MSVLDVTSTRRRQRVGGPKPAPRRRPGERLLPYLLAAPAVIYLVAFQGIPFLQQVVLSFSDTSLLNPTSIDLIGLDNYRDVFADPGFLDAVRVTIVYVVACVAGTMLLGLGTALLMNRKFKGRGLARSLLIIPWAAPAVAVALVMAWIFNPQYGVANDALGGVGLAPSDGQWLDSTSRALGTILFITIWQLFPFTAVIILAALQAVPEELHEAALLDGATWTQRFRAVTWPVIQPTISILALLMTIWSIRRFELIWLMTQGGPAGSTNTLVIDLYRRGFVERELGHAAAVGFVGVVISLAITVIFFVVSNRAEKSA
ncbi:sugar ABC transporter [Micromonospora echinospora]|uniref:Carbohydrate ABC transporter membrane protein 1, CUT1 family n=1 Tax=Micromonospora echinospora TaxID=1877 RepID=A0A1C4YZV5_MICEC|nr:sugar ABC transporter permease [Micromonospora echinospora]OZV77154.1 sugar ABC transporter [Micromonospora echinospora]SCF26167.1 carbohydrate ABC transporter membrane protein 1, CUT1 family [Micromonospora echinospora]